MAIYSILGKSLITLMIIGGGVTGTGLGIVSSNARQESTNSVNLHESNLNLGIQQNIDLSRGEDTSKLHVSREVRLEPTFNQNQGKKRIESKAQEPSQKELEEVVPILSPEKELFKEVKAQSDQSSEVKKEISWTSQQNHLAQKTPKAPAKPRPRRPKRRERPSIKSLMIEEPLRAREDDLSNKNWFLLKWNNTEDLDDSEWMVSECTPNIKDEKAVFTCPWNFDSEKMIELKLDLSSNESLKGKNWSDLDELTFSFKSRDFASLELTFSGDQGQIITIFLKEGKKT